jgi:hypothetical protein
LVYPGGPFWAWVGASIYIIGLSIVLLRRFVSEKWRDIKIFEDSAFNAAAQVSVPAGLAAAQQPAE